MFMSLDLAGIAGATVAAMIIGALWYSPLLFVKPWSLAQGKEWPCAPQKGAGLAIFNALVMNLIQAIALSEVFRWRMVATVMDGLLTALLVAIGFTLANQLMRDRFHGATPMLSLINGANTIVVYLAMGLVLSLV